MMRREFLVAAVTAAPLPALGDLITAPAGVDPAADRTLTEADLFGPPCNRIASPRGRARVAIVFCPGFRPHGWRDLPASGEIVKLLEPMSLRAARQAAKRFNRSTAATRNATADAWAMVIANDGRLAADARRRAKGGQN